jgi:short-subunit dehydrogenase
MQKTWLITGCSTGLGRSLAEVLRDKGSNVVATARRRETLNGLEGENVLLTELDVTRPDTIKAAVAATVERFGRIDVLVNNAGYGLLGAVEECSDEEARAVFDVNVFGLLTMLREVLPSMRAQGSGHVINLSSIVGLISFPGSGLYAATKHAVEALGESLYGELKPLGIKVTTIESGPFRTDFHGRSLTFAVNRWSEYEATAGKRRDAIAATYGRQAGDPVKAAEAMIAVTEMDEPPLRLPLGAIAYELAYDQLDKVRAEIQAFESLGKPTDFPS